MVDKNQAIIDFLLNCPQIAYNPVFFNAINAKDNDKQIITQANDVSLNSKYIDGSILKRYIFTLIDFRSVIYQPLPKVEGYMNENVEEMLDVQSIMDWVNEQADLQNYPDFGENCIIDSMSTTSDNPNLNGIDTNVTPALAKYSMSIQIDYLDTSKAVWSK
jgi:PhoPQ-activated pathogenicity-related protein